MKLSPTRGWKAKVLWFISWDVIGMSWPRVRVNAPHASCSRKLRNPVQHFQGCNTSPFIYTVLTSYPGVLFVLVWCAPWWEGAGCWVKAGPSGSGLKPGSCGSNQSSVLPSHGTLWGMVSSVPDKRDPQLINCATEALLQCMEAAAWVAQFA